MSDSRFIAAMLNNTHKPNQIPTHNDAQTTRCRMSIISDFVDEFNYQMMLGTKSGKLKMNKHLKDNVITKTLSAGCDYNTAYRLLNENNPAKEIESIYTKKGWNYQFDQMTWDFGDVEIGEYNIPTLIMKYTSPNKST